jgi:DNA-binding NarL/FixJ family response regulator
MTSDNGSRREQILLIHSDNALRRTWREALSDLEQIEGVSEAVDANQALHTLATMTPDVAIIELSLPGINGIELARQMVRRQPTIAAIICGHNLEPSLLTESFHAGARCYLDNDSADDVVKAVTSACRGGSYFTDDVRRVLNDMILEEYVLRLRRRAVVGRYGTLTSRECEILQKLIAGRSSKEIATELNISVNTVDTHRARIMQKLNVHSLAELTKYALLDADE